MATNTNYIQKSSDGEAVSHLEDSVIYQSGGRIGIGTTSPASDSKLHVKENGSTAGTWYGRVIASGESAAVIMGQVNGKAWIGGHNAALTSWADLSIQADGGNVGIGNTSPGEKLVVNGAIVIGSKSQSIPAEGTIWIESGELRVRLNGTTKTVTVT